MCTEKASRVFLLYSCKLIATPGVTGLAVGKCNLRLSLPTLDPAHQPHPGEHLRQGEGQGEVVGDIVIATCTKLVFEMPPLQGTRAPLTRRVGGYCALVKARRGGDGGGCRPLVPPRSTG